MAHYTFMAKHRNFSHVFPRSLGTERRARHFEMRSPLSCPCQASLPSSAPAPPSSRDGGFLLPTRKLLGAGRWLYLGSGLALAPNATEHTANCDSVTRGWSLKNSPRQRCGARNWAAACTGEPHRTARLPGTPRPLVLTGAVAGPELPSCCPVKAVALSFQNYGNLREAPGNDPAGTGGREMLLHHRPRGFRL